VGEVNIAASMQITFKLYASLGEYLPADRRRGNELTLDVAEGATIEQVTTPFGLPPKLVHLVLVNGVFIAPAERASKALMAGDVLAIWPPVAGG
jgi:sulfur carrier protein ThiS